MRKALVALVALGLTACSSAPPAVQDARYNGPWMGKSSPKFYSCHAHAQRHGACRVINKKEWA